MTYEPFKPYTYQTFHKQYTGKTLEPSNPAVAFLMDLENKGIYVYYDPDSDAYTVNGLSGYEPRPDGGYRATTTMFKTRQEVEPYLKMAIAKGLKASIKYNSGHDEHYVEITYP